MTATKNQSPLKQIPEGRGPDSFFTLPSRVQRSMEQRQKGRCQPVLTVNCNALHPPSLNPGVTGVYIRNLETHLQGPLSRVK